MCVCVRGLYSCFLLQCKSHVLQVSPSSFPSIPDSKTIKCGGGAEPVNESLILMFLRIACVCQNPPFFRPSFMPCHIFFHSISPQNNLLLDLWIWRHQIASSFYPLPSGLISIDDYRLAVSEKCHFFESAKSTNL